MKERDITAKVLKSMRDDPRFGTCAVEIKIVHGKTLNGGALKEHQFRALTIANKDRMYHKIVDAGYQNPFDAVVLKHVDAYLVIYFDTKPVNVWAIPIAKVTEGRSVTLTWAIENGVLVNC